MKVVLNLEKIQGQKWHRKVNYSSKTGGLNWFDNADTTEVQAVSEINDHVWYQSDISLSCGSSSS